jgi:cytochrome c biogenesis protein CcdA
VLQLVALVAAIAVVDSINPTTIGPALYLATADNARRSLSAFTAGVGGVSLAGGLFLTFGPGQLLIDLIPHPGKKVEHQLEVALGVAAVLIALVLWLLRSRLSGHVHEKAHQVDRSSLLLGAGIMLVELPTAFPYFAVIAAIVSADVGRISEALLVLLFNVIFVAPLLGILVARTFAGKGAVERLQRLRVWLHTRMGVLLPLAVLIVGIVLLAIGGAGLAQD